MKSTKNMSAAASKAPPEKLTAKTRSTRPGRSPVAKSRGASAQKPASDKSVAGKKGGKTAAAAGANAALKLPGTLTRQLGKRTDTDLAGEFDVPVTAVRIERQKRGIVAHHWSNWTPKTDKLLGTMSDAAVAKKLGLTPNAVNRRRKLLGIEPFGPSTTSNRHKWTKRQTGWLGKLTDAEIARRIGLDGSTVAAKRNSLAIQTVRKGRPSRQWSKAELAMLGKFPDTQVARKLGIPRRKVIAMRQSLDIKSPVVAASEQRWTSEVVAMLGKKPDVQIARETGISVAAVRGYRSRHGIAGHRSQFRWSPREIKRLGTESDQSIADSLGITRAQVMSKRNTLRIAALPAGIEIPVKKAPAKKSTRSAAAAAKSAKRSKASKSRRQTVKA